MLMPRSKRFAQLEAGIIREKEETLAKLEAKTMVDYYELKRLNVNDWIRIYHDANVNYNDDHKEFYFAIVSELKQLIIKTDLAPSPSSIISATMDIVDVRNAIIQYFYSLYTQGRLYFPTDEFDSTGLFGKTNISRLFGRDAIAKYIEDNECQYVRVPNKVAVLPIDDSLSFWIERDNENIVVVSYDNFEVYAQMITDSVDRKLSRAEWTEFLDLIDSVNYVDLWPANFILTENHIYVIDTENKSFRGLLDWGVIILRFDSWLWESDRVWLKSMIDMHIARREPSIIYTIDNLSYMDSNFKGEWSQFYYSARLVTDNQAAIKMSINIKDEMIME